MQHPGGGFRLARAGQPVLRRQAEAGVLHDGLPQRPGVGVVIEPGSGDAQVIRGLRVGWILALERGQNIGGFGEPAQGDEEPPGGLANHRTAGKSGQRRLVFLGGAIDEPGELVLCGAGQRLLIRPAAAGGCSERRPDLHFRGRHGIVGVFLVRQQDLAGGVPQFEAKLARRVDGRRFGMKNGSGIEVGFLPVYGPAIHSYGQAGVRQQAGDVQVEDGGDAAGGLRPALEEQNRGRGGARDAAGVARRDPEFGEGTGLLGIQKLHHVLGGHQTGLNFHVAAAVVAQPAAIPGIGGCPDPELFAGDLERVGPVRHAGARERIVGGEEGLPAAIGEQAELDGVVGGAGPIHSGGVDGPGIEYAGAVRGGHPHRIYELEPAIGQADGGVGPPLVGLADRALIVDPDSLQQQSAAGTKGVGDAPFHPADAVHGGDENGPAAIVVGGGGEMNGRHRDQAMSYRETGLDAAGRPGSARGDVVLLDGRIGIEDVRAGQLIAAGIEVAAQVGQYQAVQVLVFEVERAPRRIVLPGRHIQAHGIRIDAGWFELVERRNGAGEPLAIGGEDDGILPHANAIRLGEKRGRTESQEEKDAKAAHIVSEDSTKPGGRRHFARPWRRSKCREAGAQHHGRQGQDGARRGIATRRAVFLMS